MTEFLRIFIPTFICLINILPPPTLALKSLEVLVVVVGSRGCTNIVRNSSFPALYPVSFHLSPPSYPESRYSACE